LIHKSSAAARPEKIKEETAMTLRDDDLNNVSGGAGTDSLVYYTVAKGDNLHSIARHYQRQGHTSVTWEKIYDWNRDIIKNPDLIQPGWRLRIYLR